MARYYGSVDVTKISKDKLVKGKKGTYAPIIVWTNDEPDQFGNHASIQENLSKEEREAGVKPNYIGNLKLAEGSTASAAPKDNTEEEDLPF